jgi:hypothetical protein
MRIISGNFVKNEAHCIETMLDSVQPYVDESYVLVDRETTDDTFEICKRRGCHVDYFDFENFSKVWNTLFYWMKGKSEWSIFIAPDETIAPELGKMLKPMGEQLFSTENDGVWFSRRHWKDLEMNELHEKDAGWFPDWQLRFIRNDFPRIYVKNYVHEWPVGLRGSLRLDKPINHFNMYWKIRMDYDFDAMNVLYNRLKAQQAADGGHNIWPDAMIKGDK